MSTFKLSGLGIYLTKGGYVVELKEHPYSGDTRYQATKETSPGVNESGETAKKRQAGWIWQPNGTIVGLTSEWCEKLQIVQKLNWKSLPKLPEGYEYQDGFPHLEYVKCGEEFLTEFYSSVTVDTPTNSTMVWDVQHRTTCDKYIVIVKKPTPAPEQWYEITNLDYIIKEGDEYYIPANEEWRKFVISIGGSARGSYLSNHKGFKIRSRIKPEEPALMPVIVEPVKGYTLTSEEYHTPLPKKSDDSIVSVKPSLLKRGFNWWVAEPVSNALRYAVITAVLWGGVEIYKNPAVVWKFLPKISVTIK